MRAATSTTDISIAEILQLVDDDLRQVEIELRHRVVSAVPIVDQINRYVHKSGGKRLRPALALLCSRLCGYSGPNAIQLGVVLELVHAATLVHDDIIDNAQFRRGRPSVNSKWGNQITVLMGDWLYMTSFLLALKTRDMRILDTLIDITCKMVEGELMQLELDSRLDITPNQQLEICKRKTACLFAGCSQLAAIVAQQDSQVVESLHRFGQSFGIAFQLIDDLLDYTSTELQLGKPVLKDLEEGKVTLPIIYLMERANEQDKAFVRRVVGEHDFSPENKAGIIRLALEHGVLDDVRREAAAYGATAKESLLSMPDNTYRRALIGLVDFVLERNR